MADRTISVTLRAITDSYRREMDKAAQATGKLVDRAGGLEQLGGKMQRVGGMMTRSVTLPLALAGGAAVKMSMDFEKSMAQMVGLVGLSADEVAGFKDRIMELSGETARAPKELADAMFFITSAGLKGKDALDALEASAKASAAGLGETKTVADLVTSAMNAYGSEVLSAQQATDDLTMAVRLGKLEPQELAGAMGRVLPIASAMGVEFNEVAAAMAGMSKTGTNAAEGATQLRGILSGLLSPSKQARDILESLHSDGLAGIHRMLKDDGLLVTLEFLVDSLGGNAAAAEQVFGNIRALSGVMDMLGSNVEGTREVFDQMTDTVGTTDSAFAAMAETAGFKNAQAFAQLQTALVQIGDVLAPVVADIAQFAGTLLKLFADLPGPVQNAVIAFGGLLAAVGPLTSIAGKVVSNWASLGRAFNVAAEGAYSLAGAGGKLARSLGPAGMVGALTGVGALVTTGVVLYQDYAKTKAEAARVTGRLVDALQAENAELETNTTLAEELALKDYAGAIREAEVGFGVFTAAIQKNSDALESLDNDLAAYRQGALSLADMLERAGLTGTELAEALTILEGTMSAGAFLGLIDDLDGLADGYETAAGTAANLDAASQDLTTSTKSWHDRIREAHGAGSKFAGEVEEVGEAAEEAVDPLDELEKSIDAVTKAYQRQIDPFFAAQDALLGHRDAQEDVTEAALEVMAAAEDAAAAVRDYGEGSDEAAKAAADLTRAERNLESAERKVVRSAMDVTTAQYKLKRMMDDGSLSIDGAREMLRRWVEQGLLTEAQAAEAAEELGLVASAASRADEQDVEIPVRTVGYQKTVLELMALERQLADLYRGSGVRISVGGGGGVPVGAASGFAGTVNKPTMFLTGEGGEPEDVLVVPHSKGGIESLAKAQPMSGLAGGWSSMTSDNRSVVVNTYYPKSEPASDSLVRSARKAKLAIS